jgi:hypothetical protein
VKVGDLVTYEFQTWRWQKGLSVDVGLVVEIGKWTGNADVKVLWSGNSVAVTQKGDHLRLLTSS